MGSNDDGSVQSEFFYYFAYGSNLLAERIHVQVKGAVFECTGVLYDYELCFFDMGARWRGAAASIEPRQPNDNKLVWGCIWRVPHSFAKELDKQEQHYHRLEVVVAVPSQKSRRIECRTYQYSNPRRVAQLPSPHYKHVIVCGAIEHSLPKDYIQLLKAMPDNGYKGRVNLHLEVIKHLNHDCSPSGSDDDTQDSV
jgi:gamma-glutamylcyclotransferase